MSTQDVGKEQQQQRRALKLMKHRMPFRHLWLRPLSLAIAILSVSCAPAIQAQTTIQTSAVMTTSEVASLPASITASYKVRMGQTNLGVIEKTLRRDGDIYRVSSDARPNPLVRLVAGGKAHEEAVFILTEDGLQSVFYSESRSGKPDRRVDFNWDQGILVFDRDGEITQQNVPDMETVDASSLPFYMMLKRIEDLAGKKIAVVTGKRVGEYRFEPPIEEDLDTSDGIVSTWRIVKNRIGSDDRSITVWVDPARRNLPIKIRQQRGDRITTLTLASIEGL